MSSLDSCPQHFSLNLNFFNQSFQPLFIPIQTDFFQKSRADHVAVLFWNCCWLPAALDKPLNSTRCRSAPSHIWRGPTSHFSSSVPLVSAHAQAPNFCQMGFLVVSWGQHTISCLGTFTWAVSSAWDILFLLLYLADAFSFWWSR